MSTASQDITCTNCGNPQTNEEFNNRTYEKWTWCNCCGQCGSRNYLTGAREITGGHGAVTVRFDGVSQDFSLPADKPIAEVLAEFRQTAALENVKSVAVSFREGDQWVRVTLCQGQHDGHETYPLPVEEVDGDPADYADVVRSQATKANCTFAETNEDIKF